MSRPSTSDFICLSLHDALPIYLLDSPGRLHRDRCAAGGPLRRHAAPGARGEKTDTRTPPTGGPDRKSTRLNSSHGYISYAVFCLKKKKVIAMTLTRLLTTSLRQ